MITLNKTVQSPLTETTSKGAQTLPDHSRQNHSLVDNFDKSEAFTSTSDLLQIVEPSSVAVAHGGSDLCNNGNKYPIIDGFPSGDLSACENSTFSHSRRRCRRSRRKKTNSWTVEEMPLAGRPPVTDDGSQSTSRPAQDSSRPQKGIRARVRVFGDGSLVGVGSRIAAYLPSNACVEAFIKPHASIESIFSSIKSSSEIGQRDMVLVAAGSLEMEYGRIRHLRAMFLELMAHLAHARVVLCELPFHRELPSWSVLNIEIYRMNKFLRGLQSRFMNLSVIPVTDAIWFRATRDRVATCFTRKDAIGRALAAQTRDWMDLEGKSVWICDGKGNITLSK